MSLVILLVLAQPVISSNVVTSVNIILFMGASKIPGWFEVESDPERFLEN
jgi:hypothetical protein